MRWLERERAVTSFFFFPLSGVWCFGVFLTYYFHCGVVSRAHGDLDSAGRCAVGLLDSCCWTWKVVDVVRREWYTVRLPPFFHILIKMKCSQEKKRCVCCLLSCQAIVYSKACAKNTLHEGGMSGRVVSVIRRLKCNLKITKNEKNTNKSILEIVAGSVSLPKSCSRNYFSKFFSFSFF